MSYSGFGGGVGKMAGGGGRIASGSSGSFSRSVSLPPGQIRQTTTVRPATSVRHSGTLAPAPLRPATSARVDFAPLARPGRPNAVVPGGEPLRRSGRPSGPPRALPHEGPRAIDRSGRRPGPSGPVHHHHHPHPHGHPHGHFFDSFFVPYPVVENVYLTPDWAYERVVEIAPSYVVVCGSPGRGELEIPERTFDSAISTGREMTREGRGPCLIYENAAEEPIARVDWSPFEQRPVVRML